VLFSVFVLLGGFHGWWVVIEVARMLIVLCFISVLLSGVKMVRHSYVGCFC
jgi:uncharacterized membrane protein